ncbi:7-cyano-7-deazaguanine synthase [Laribacter hongkongensis]|uniref:7-cyano-7-deazaguanine synthase n=1 Tax=Laribacter hongkongensis TaxID=168471 RepID=UPI001EFE8083|nr:7-cyano-7-deazaguanine synthase [Laribacter hongkongensis]MCG8999782.1 7-cyano-7-deazaguanine synthase [Laribacter hongkongensis]MCG9063369.1 7-cyano-7-deazaguanine synthase [Laribacter hongkongensis]
MSRHLVMLSGGADSVFALLDAIERGGEITICHVVFGHSCRKEMERKSASDIANHVMANIAPGRVRFIESFVTLPGYAHRDLLFLIGIAHNEAALSATHQNPYTDIWFGDGEISGEPNDYLAVDRNMKEIFRLMCDPVYHRSLISNPPEIHSQTATGLSKQAARERIGEKLWSMTWGCRCPVRGRPCGHCKTCKERAETHAPD